MSSNGEHHSASVLLIDENDIGAAFPLYYALFPTGIEDIVKHEFEVIAPPLRVVWRSPLPKKRLLQRGGYAFKESEKMQITEKAGKFESRLLHDGALYFTLHDKQGSSSAAKIEDVYFFFERARCVRCVELLALHLSDFSCANELEIAEQLTARAADRIRKAVVEHLSALRMASAFHRHAHDGLDGFLLNAGICDSNVLFRVNSVRCDKTVPCAFTSQELSRHVGEVLYTAFEPFGWRVNMLYHNVEFFAHQKGGHAYLGLVLTPPALPRIGEKTIFTQQLGLELLRQRIGHVILQEGYEGGFLRAAVPRPSSFPKDIRLEKGKNAMNPALASALSRYSGVRSGEVIVDPFCGSGTTLLEAWIASGFAPLVAIGGDFCRDDAMRSWRNLQADALYLAAVNGLLTSQISQMEDSCEIRALCRKLLCVLSTHVENMSLPYNCDTGQNGGSALNPSYPAAAPVEAENIAGELKKLLARHDQLSLLTVQWDAARIPIRSGSVDCIVSDLPFGRRCGNHRINVNLYPSMLMECHRILIESVDNSMGPLIVDGDKGELDFSHEEVHVESDPWWKVNYVGNRRSKGRAVLLTIEGKLMMESLEEIRSKCPFDLLHPPFKVDMGGMFPYVFVLEKT